MRNNYQEFTWYAKEAHTREELLYFANIKEKAVIIRVVDIRLDTVKLGDEILI